MDALASDCLPPDEISSMLEKGVTSAFNTEFGIVTAVVPTQVKTTYSKKEIMDNTIDDQISEGLGDQDDYIDDDGVIEPGVIPPSNGPIVVIPRGSSIKDEELEHELDVEDPEVEASVSASKIKENPAMSSDQAFAQELVEGGTHLSKRKKKFTGTHKAKVSAFNGDGERSSF